MDRAPTADLVVGRSEPRARPDAEYLLALADEVVRVAGDRLRERFERGRERGVRTKSTPTDLVSEADLESERTIRELLAVRRPEDGFLGEESAADDGGSSRAGTSGLRWVVDPLDGTVNFLFAIPQWCVSIAVEDDSGTLAGVIYDPTHDEMFAGLHDGPSTLNGAPLRASNQSDLSQSLVSTGFAYDAEVRAAQAKVIENMIPRVRDIRRMGSAALDLAWTAVGRYDAFFERTVKAWDIAAGVLICEGAGLEVQPLEEQPGLPAGVLAAPRGLVGPLLELVG